MTADPKRACEAAIEQRNAAFSPATPDALARVREAALERVADAARRCLPPEAYGPKADGTAVGALRDALAALARAGDGGERG